MFKKLAKIKYLPNNYEIIENGDHVICALSGKKISLNELNYWNVDLQEPYYSYIEAFQKREKKNNLFPSIMCPNPLIRVFNY
jgi:hypothetical protein